jgi:tetratricopeptide (TPR) repeat protein
MALVILSLSMMLAGCESRSYPQVLADASAAFNAGDYDSAYRDSIRVVRNSEGDMRYEAAFIAGSSAYKKGDLRSAALYLRRAALSKDPTLAADASATLGMVFAELGRYHDSAVALLDASQHLAGEDRARAFFYAAIAQQKLGRWPQARTNLILARGATSDEAFREQVNDQLHVTGYTLQTGAFSSAGNAEQAVGALQSRAADASVGQPRVSTETANGRTIYHVQIGEFTSFDSARQARTRLGESQAIIVPLMR